MSRGARAAADGDEHLVAAELAVRRCVSDAPPSPSRRAAVTLAAEPHVDAELPQRLGDRLAGRAARAAAAAGRRARTASPASRAPATPSPSRSRRRRRRGRAAGRAPPWRWSPRAASTARPRAARRSAARRRPSRCRPRPRAGRSAGSRCRRRRSTTTVRSPSSRPAPRTRAMPAPSTHVHLAGVVPVRGEGVAAGEGRGDVLLAGDRLRRAVDGARLGEHLGAAQQRLARHARPVGALAADQLALDEDGGQPAPDDDVGDVLPRRPGPEDDDVVGLLSGCSPTHPVGVVDWPPCRSTPPSSPPPCGSTPPGCAC